MGEFGAVSVVAGSVDDKMTMPLQIENYYQAIGGGLSRAFALASLLLLLAAITLVIKIALEWRHLAPRFNQTSKPSLPH
jgi:sulfate transport system permease protein